MRTSSRGVNPGGYLISPFCFYMLGGGGQKNVRNIHWCGLSPYSQSTECIVSFELNIFIKWLHIL